MKYFILVMMFCLVLLADAQQPAKTAADIKKEMGQIMHSTNWGNQAEADSANAKIAKLTKQMMMLGETQNAQSNMQKGNILSEEDMNADVEYKMKLWDQMEKSAEGGKNADLLLAKPLREDIIEAYQDDESPKINSIDYLEEQTFLCIDMSLPTIQRTIDQMDKFKSIKILLITGGKSGADVNLEDILNRAAKYPLEELHIINFKHFITTIPSNVGQFTKLKSLTLFNNQINKLPSDISSLTELKKLYLDKNPVSTLFPEINFFRMLDTLGIATTNIPESEVKQIQALLPNCKILLK